MRRVNVVDYIASSRQPGLTRLPPSEPTPSIGLQFDGWILHKAGVAFVWVLESEMAASPDPALRRLRRPRMIRNVLTPGDRARARRW
jgi:hypothetical protein